MGHRGQTTLEYFILLGIVIGGLIGMQVYMKRSVQGKMKTSVEQISTGLSYSPGATRSDSTVTKNIQTQSRSYTVHDSQDMLDSDKLDYRDVKVQYNQSSDLHEETLPLAQEPDRVR